MAKIAVAVALVISAVAGMPAPDGGQRTHCLERRGIVAANRQAVVLRQDGGWFACDVRSRRVRSIGGYDPDDGGGTRLVRLAGRHVGYHDRRCNSGGRGAAAILLNGVTGTRRAFADPADPGEALGLQVTAAGSIAWVRQRLSPQASRYEVVVAQGGTSPVVVEEGPVADFAAGSLATAGGRLYWFAQGRATSAPLR